MSDLHDLMRRHVVDPPPDPVRPGSLLAAGRRRVRRRRTTRLGGAALLLAGVVGVAAVSTPSGHDRHRVADHPPAPDAPTVRLSDATQAVLGRDYRVLASHTNRNLDRANGQYYDGVTDDGLILFQDGPHGIDSQTRLALMQPTTGQKDWLPGLGIGQDQFWAAELGTERLVLLSDDDLGGDTMDSTLVAHLFDRGSHRWTTMRWPTLPALRSVAGGVLGPDGRLYVSVPATQGKPPAGGWPTQAGGDAEDADADGDTYDLWSVSLTDAADVRDEHLRVGGVAFTDTTMVWTDSTNGAAGLVHVRDLATDEETTFDPHMGARCNLLSFGATATRVVLSQYCGTYAGEVRDDRVQVLTTGGDQVVTIQDDGIDGYLTGPHGDSDLVSVSSYKPGGGGTYLYDLADDRFLRISDAVSKFGVGGPTANGTFLWHTPVNHRHGATQWLGELVSP